MHWQHQTNNFERSHGLMAPGRVRIREMLLRCSMRRIRMGGKSLPPLVIVERPAQVPRYQEPTPRGPRSRLREKLVFIGTCSVTTALMRIVAESPGVTRLRFSLGTTGCRALTTIT